MISLYETLTYEEEERERHPALYSRNRLCEHISIKGKENVIAFINKFELSDSLIDQEMSFSILWNLPRKQYNENEMYVCVSGCSHDEKEPFKNFVISDNTRDEKARAKAIEVIKYINRKIA